MTPNSGLAKCSTTLVCLFQAHETTAITNLMLCIAACQLYLYFVEFLVEQVSQLPQLSDLLQLHAVGGLHRLVQHLLDSKIHVVCVILHLCCVF